MIWQDIAITVSNVGLFLALLPLFLTTVLSLKSTQFGLRLMAPITAAFLVLVGIATISLGASFGGSMTLVNAGTWLMIGIAVWLKREKA
ncbi:MAG: hypothetical protein Q7R48_00835 [bacterium]|nr:hypothetical protein [bacterium]